MKKISALAIAGVMVAALAAGSAFAETELKVSGEVRVRHVDVNNYDLNSNSADSGNSTGQRTRVNVDAKVNETTKAYVSLQDTRNWGSEKQPDGTVADGKKSTTSTGTDTQAVDVSQAYIQFDKLAGQPLSAKLGRQSLAYGDQRLIGGLEWTDNARRFDAVKLVYSQEAVNVDFFMANVKESNEVKYTPPTTGPTPGTDAYLNGLYATLKTIPMHKALDLYLLQRTGTAVGENLLTYGLRLDGGVAGIDWTAEFAMQGGDASTGVTKEASMLAVKAGYTLADVMGLRIGAEYDSGTGDKSATDNKNQDFDQLYPTAHPLYGVMDAHVNDIKNLNAISLNVSVKPADGLKVAAEYWDFKTTEGTNAIGTEMNLQAWYAVSSNVDLHGFIAQFTPDSGDAASNVTLQAAVKF